MALQCRAPKRKCAAKSPGFYKRLTTIDLKDSQGGKNQYRDKKTWREGELFDIEILKEADDKVFVTYPGWDSKYNEWLPRSQCADVINIQCLSTPSSLDDGQKLFCANLRLDIKRNLLGKRKADPHISITRDIQFDVYEHFFGTQNKIRYPTNSELNDVLGTG
ncbi:uncharacterized protein LOC119732925 [Patiria miniata]|uniref:Chromo domain-containing protein n=1 Tax=Patiria miniata TaxID=46514 RepID=A0A914AFB3_PATMI|nr:uncharacterized protein LOC119732925 [Patiria miniata]